MLRPGKWIAISVGNLLWFSEVHTLQDITAHCADIHATAFGESSHLRGIVEHALVGCVARCTLNGVTIHELVRSRTISLKLSEIRNNRYESDLFGHPLVAHLFLLTVFPAAS